MNLKQIAIIRQDLDLGKGKIASQCGHAFIEAFLKTLKQKPEWINEWINEGQAKIVLKAKNEKELLEYFEKLKKLFPTVLIKDAGHTQTKPGTITCLGVGPVPENEINKFTSKLKLL